MDKLDSSLNEFQSKEAQNTATKNKAKLKQRKKLCKKSGFDVKCSSKFLSSHRLTQRVGLFSKGKISNSVSRYEDTASPKSKARVEQDLRKVLNLANGNKAALEVKLTNVVPSPVLVMPECTSVLAMPKCTSVLPMAENSSDNFHHPTNRSAEDSCTSPQPDINVELNMTLDMISGEMDNIAFYMRHKYAKQLNKCTLKENLKFRSPDKAAAACKAVWQVYCNDSKSCSSFKSSISPSTTWNDSKNHTSFKQLMSPSATENDAFNLNLCSELQRKVVPAVRIFSPPEASDTVFNSDSHAQHHDDEIFHWDETPKQSNVKYATTSPLYNISKESTTVDITCTDECLTDKDLHVASPIHRPPTEPEYEKRFYRHKMF